MNSKRERLDNVVSNFYLSKKSKLRQFEICKSRKKVCVPDENKIKHSLSSKFVMEKWRKSKQHKGPGYFRKNRKIDSDKRKYEEWEKIPIVPWGGEHTMGRRTHHGEESIPWGGEHTMGRRAYHGEESTPWGGEHTMGRRAFSEFR